MPPITTAQVFQFLPWLILLYLAYILYTLRNRIKCSFRRYDKSKASKWAKVRNKDGTWGDVEFEGGLYHVEPARTVLGWSMILGIFPVPIREADYVQGSARALHPDNFNNTFSAEERKQLDRTDNLKGLQAASLQTLKGNQKQGMLERYMPFILIAGFAIVGFFLYQQQQKIDMVGNATNLIQAELAKLLAR